MAKAIMLAFVALWTLSAFSTISNVGKQRRPVTPKLAASVTFVVFVESIAALYVYTQL